MKEESLRLKKINELIRQQLSEIFARELKLKQGVLATIAKVVVTPDLRYAKVFVSVFPGTEASYVLQTLKKEAYLLQGTLNRTLHMRPLPRVEFLLDETEERAQVVEKIFKDPEF